MARVLRFFVWIICWGLLSSAQAEETATLRQALIGYIEGIQTLEAEFSETRAEQSSLTGKVFLKRPSSESDFGKLKFSYNPPKLLEVVSFGGTIYVANNNTKTMDNLPLSSTPLFILLRSKIRLGDMVIEKDLKDDGALIYWTLTQTEDTGGENPEITLKFKKAPLMLEGWVVHDLTGSDTTVQLTSLTTGRPLSDELFKKPVVAEK